MPNIKSSKKSVKTNKVTAAGNIVYLSRVKNSIKKIEKAVRDKDQEKASAELKIAIAHIDKCTSKGLMKKNTCNREKARLNKIVKECK